MSWNIKQFTNYNRQITLFPLPLHLFCFPKIIKLESTPQALLDNIPDELVSEIPYHLLDFEDSDLASVQKINRKKWKREQVQQRNPVTLLHYLLILRKTALFTPFNAEALPSTSSARANVCLHPFVFSLFRSNFMFLWHWINPDQNSYFPSVAQ